MVSSKTRPLPDFPSWSTSPTFSNGWHLLPKRTFIIYFQEEDSNQLHSLSKCFVNMDTEPNCLRHREQVSWSVMILVIAPGLSCLHLVLLKCLVRLYLLAKAYLHWGQNRPPLVLLRLPEAASASWPDTFWLALAGSPVTTVVVGEFCWIIWTTGYWIGAGLWTWIGCDWMVKDGINWCWLCMWSLKNRAIIKYAPL